jgi:hypothetical protein
MQFSIFAKIRALLIFWNRAELLTDFKKMRWLDAIDSHPPVEPKLKQ